MYIAMTQNCIHKFFNDVAENQKVHVLQIIKKCTQSKCQIYDEMLHIMPYVYSNCILFI